MFKTNRTYFFNFSYLRSISSFFLCHSGLSSPCRSFACELSGAVPWEEITSSGFDPSITFPPSVLLHVPCGLRVPGTQIHPSQSLILLSQRPFHLWKRRLIAIHALSGSPHANRRCSIRWGLGGMGLVPRRDFWWTCGWRVCKIAIPIRKDNTCQTVDVAFKCIFLNPHHKGGDVIVVAYVALCFGRSCVNTFRS